VDMFYGSPTLGVTTVNTYHDPAAVFALYEGFEANGTGAFSQTTLCGAEATPNDLEASDANPYAGGGSLYAKAGAVTMLAAPLATPLADYQLRAWFYDSDATTSSHYISPDLADACAVDAAGKRTLADGAPSSLSHYFLWLTHPLVFLFLAPPLVPLVRLISILVCAAP